MADLELDAEIDPQIDALVRRLNLAGITFDRTLGEIRDRVALDVSDGANVPARLTVTVSHHLDAYGITFRHEARVAIGHKSEDNDGEGAAAIIEASILVHFSSESELTPNPEVVRALGRTYSHRIMYPYLRELVQSTLARLGVAGATLGLLKVPPWPADADRPPPSPGTTR